MRFNCVELGSLVTHKKGFAFKSKDYQDSGKPVVRVSNFTLDSISDDDLKFVNDEVALETKSVTLKELDIVIATVGSWPSNPASIVGKTIMVPSFLDGALLNQNSVRLRVNNNSLTDQEFLFYALKNQAFSDYLISTAQGSANQASITLKDILNYHVPWPPEEERKRIVSIIGSMRRKITLNRQINQTLEDMAQAIFKSWFVDFEPVKAKIQALENGGTEDDANLAAMQAISGKTADQLATLKTQHPDQYQQLHHTASLFPSAMQDSELGEIPAGWQVKSLDTVAHYQNGLALQKFRPEDENDFLPVVKIAQLKKGFTDGEEKASPNINPSCIIDDGDVIFSWSGSLVVDIWCGGKAALNQHLFKVTSEDYPKWFYYYFTKHHLDEFQRIAQAKAVTMGHIKREHLKQALCAVPANDLIRNLGIRIQSQLDKAIASRLESRTLTELRDTLLPKLLSGELQISTEDAL